tara:strand:+ start:927 stop:1388 length:462 start_codon:yes stop_codon:yes gene_type:complete
MRFTVIYLFTLLVSFGVFGQKKNTQLDKTKGGIVVRFNINSCELTDIDKAVLDSIFLVIKEKTYCNVRSILLTNRSCLYEYNFDKFIGVKRAQTIVDYMEQKGLPRILFKIIDYRDFERLKERQVILLEGARNNVKCDEQSTRGITVEFDCDF